MPYGSFVVAALLLLAAPLAAEPITPVADILQDTHKFDRKWLCLAGKTSELLPTISPVRHHKYWTAKLEDNDSRILLFAYGVPPFESGETIEACGIFAHLKKAQSTGEVFKDEFNVTNVLRGPLMRAGRVKITPTGIVSVAAGGQENGPRYADPSQPFNAAPAPSRTPPASSR